MLEKLQDVDLGDGNKIDLNEVKIMLQQFIGAHSSYLKPVMNKSLSTIYDTLSNLESKKKIWK